MVLVDQYGFYDLDVDDVQKMFDDVVEDVVGCMDISCSWYFYVLFVKDSVEFFGFGVVLCLGEYFDVE